MRAMLAATLLVILSGPAMAQSNDASTALRKELALLSGTISVQSTPQMSGGVLTGCMLTFEDMQQDFTYLKGNFVRVSGSFGFMGAEGKVGLVVKVVAAELDPDLPNLGGKMLDLRRAYLVANDFSSNFGSLVTSSPGENGGVFSIYQLEPGIMTIFEGLESDKVTVAFSVGEGSMDIQMPVELDVTDVHENGIRTRSPQAPLNFMDCAQKLFAS